VSINSPRIIDVEVVRRARIFVRAGQRVQDALRDVALNIALDLDRGRTGRPHWSVEDSVTFVVPAERGLASPEQLRRQVTNVFRNVLGEADARQDAEAVFPSDAVSVAILGDAERDDAA